MHDKVNLNEKLASFNELWVPKVVAELNGQYVKVVKFQDEYVWHQHENEDEMFLVLKGQMELHYQEEVVVLNEGEFSVVPRGVQHKPVADEICEVLVFEPVTTRNTGEKDHQYTIEPENLDKI